MMLVISLQKVIPISSFTEPFNSRKSFIVSFRMKECEPCDQFESLIEGEQRKNPTSFDIYSVNCEDNKAGRLCTRYNVTIAPTAVMFNSRKSKRSPVFLDADKRSDVGLSDFVKENVYKPYREVSAKELLKLLNDEIIDSGAAFIF